MKKLKILIIDSNPIIYIGFKSIFKNSSIFEVSESTDKKNEICDKINELNIDIVISEIDFKNGNVTDVLKIFKKKVNKAKSSRYCIFKIWVKRTK